MAFEKDRMNSRGDGGFREQARPLRSPSGGGAGAGMLRRVGAVKADGARPAAGVLFDEIAEADKIIDQSVVAEEGAALGEHHIVAPGGGELLDRPGHLGGR